MVLHREGRDVNAFQPLDHVVVQADVGHPDPAVRRVSLALKRGVNREAVVLGRDLNPAGAPVQDRLVDATVTVLELVGVEAKGPAENLVTEADAEEGNSRGQDLAQQIDLVVGG